MRQIGTLPDATSARTLAGYLGSLSIETRLEESPEGWVVWVCDEDRLPQARREFQSFQQSPSDERYRQTPPVELKLKQESLPASLPRARPPIQSPLVTGALVAISLVVTVLYWSQPTKNLIAHNFFIEWAEFRNGGGPWVKVYNRLDEIRDKGELWRLVTPIFIHMHILHLVFNLFCLWDMGRPLERFMGTWRFALFVLIVAVVSNLSQYFFAEVRLDDWRVVTQSSPAFGGLSGIGYGLFGFLWIRVLYDPGCGLQIARGTVMIMLIWLFLCMTGTMGPIANTAHVVGMALGMIVGYISARWNGFGQADFES